MGARGNSGVITSPDPARLRRRVPRASTRSRAGDLARALRRGGRRRVPSGDAPGRGHDPHRRARRRPRRSRAANGDATLVAVLERCGRTRRATPCCSTPDLLPVLARPASSTRAAAGSRCCSTRCSRSPTAGRSPSPTSSTTPAAVAAHLAGDDIAGLRYEVMYLLDAEDSTIGGFKEHVGRDRRLDRRRRRRRHVELPRPHQRHRCRDRSRHRRGPAAQDPGHRPVRAGRRGAVGARGRASPTARPSSDAPVVDDRGRRGRGRRRRAPPAHRASACSASSRAGSR